MEKDWIEPKDAYVYVGQQKLRRGYTTGSCAAAAAQAAARALFGEEHPQSVQLAVPKGLTLSIPVHSLQTGERWAKASVCKDSGDDPDVTNGIEVFVTLSVSDRPGIAVCGGVGVGRITKEQESISGDNYSVLCENGQFVLCLSDGMGSGIEANRESETVVELFEQFLRAGFPRIMAARMINSMLLLQPKEGMFSTFDVASINLYTGVCSFLKGGASPTFLRRDTWVEVVESTSLAAGLVSQTDFDTTTKKLYDGDYLVMMTDGVLDALPGDRTEQMKQLLLEVKNSEPREFARELLERVLRLGSCRARDDMTVLVARIWKK